MPLQSDDVTTIIIILEHVIFMVVYVSRLAKGFKGTPFMMRPFIFIAKLGYFLF